MALDFEDGICCFTGHRVIAGDLLRSGVLNARLDAAIASLAARGIKTFRAGGARGFDTLAAQAVLRAREQYGLQLHLYFPCPSQADAWTEQERIVYNQIKEAADKVFLTSPSFYKTCMLTRDRAMVTGADVCVAYFTGARGGTAYTVNYALKSGLELINLYTMEDAELNLAN